MYKNTFAATGAVADAATGAVADAATVAVADAATGAVVEADAATFNAAAGVIVPGATDAAAGGCCVSGRSGRR